MVLNGSYLPKEEIEKTLPAWNMKPVIFGHPEQKGKKVSAAITNMIEHHVGFINNPRMEKERMFTDIFLHKDKIDRLDDGKTLKKLVELGDKINVSTAYFDHGSVEENGIKDGKQYSSVTKNISPDHLAILLDEDGSCSVKDGCGINVNQQMGTDMSDNQKTSEENLKVNSDMAAAAAAAIDDLMTSLTSTLETSFKTNADEMKAMFKTCIDKMSDMDGRLAKLEKGPGKKKTMKANDDEEGEDTDDEDFETQEKEKKAKKEKMKTNAADGYKSVPVDMNDSIKANNKANNPAADSDIKTNSKKEVIGRMPSWEQMQSESKANNSQK